MVGAKTLIRMDSDNECRSDDSDVEILEEDGYYRPIKKKDEYKREAKRLRRMDPEYECNNVDSDVEILDNGSEYSNGFASEDDDNYGDNDGIDDSCKREDDLPVERYTVRMQEDISKQQQQDITQVSATLSIPRAWATILLQHYKWKFEEAQDAWFADEEKVRKDVRLLEKQLQVPIENSEDTIGCPICLDEFPVEEMRASTICGHRFCNSCWTQYISIKIDDGPGCLMMRCPDSSCGAAVGEDMVDRLVSGAHKKKYSYYLCRSYVEDNKNIKWCPGPGCECGVEFVHGSSTYNVVCICGHYFCWNCLGDAHSPVDCDTVHKWVLKNSAESENVAWILANSKSCPKCKKPIQKNKGCMHMTCSCGFQFCWLCLADWKTHGEKTGGFYECNIYKEVKTKGRRDEEEKINNKAKDYLDRYAFYYGRFAENQKSRLKAVESLQKAKAVHLAMLSDRYTIPETKLDFITDAWLQIIECRRVLTWTYAYGYYLPQSELAGKKEFFEFLQGEAESALERLHRCADKELESYLLGDDAKAKEDFNSLREKLLNLTKITNNYFGNLVRALENGLSDV